MAWSTISSNSIRIASTSVSTFSSGILNLVANLTTDNQGVVEQLEFSSFQQFSVNYVSK